MVFGGYHIVAWSMFEAGRATSITKERTMDRSRRKVPCAARGPSQHAASQALRRRSAQ